MIKKNQIKEKILKLDITKKKEIVNAIQKAIAWKGKIDVLVNNAAYCVIGAIEESSEKEMKATFETNVFGLVAVTKAILPIMRKQRSGHIINMSSHLGVQGKKGIGIHCATKFAVEAISESLAQEVAQLNIKVTIIEPGPFRTPFIRNVVVSKEIGDYKNIMVPCKEHIKKIGTLAPGDVTKGACAIYAITTMDKPPLRLPLGNLAVDEVLEKAYFLKKQALENEQLSRNCDDK